MDLFSPDQSLFRKNLFLVLFQNFREDFFSRERVIFNDVGYLFHTF